jgi:hypothetical protein
MHKLVQLARLEEKDDDSDLLECSSRLSEYDSERFLEEFKPLKTLYSRVSLTPIHKQIISAERLNM